MGQKTGHGEQLISFKSDNTSSSSHLHDLYSISLPFRKKFLVKKATNYELCIQLSKENSGAFLGESVQGVILDTEDNMCYWIELQEGKNFTFYTDQHEELIVEIWKRDDVGKESLTLAGEVRLYELAKPLVEVEKMVERCYMEKYSLNVYTVIVKNNSNIGITYGWIKDSLLNSESFIAGSVVINGDRFPGKDPRRGFEIPDLQGGGALHSIQYQTSLKKVARQNKKHSQVELIFHCFPSKTAGLSRYTMLSNNRGEKKEKAYKRSIAKEKSSNYECFKLMGIDQYLPISHQQLPLSSILEMKGQIQLLQSTVIATPKVESMGGQVLTGYKLVMEGMLKLVIQYNSFGEEEKVCSGVYAIPFGTFLMLPEEYREGSRLEPVGEIVEVYGELVNERLIFANIVINIRVKSGKGENGRNTT